MENLENQCLERLNNILFKFDLQVVNRDDEFQNKYVLLDIQENHIVSSYKSINEMLFSSQPIFYALLMHKMCLSFFIAAVPTMGKRYQRYINAYNNIKNLENSSSLEELVIKMDLLGI